MAQNHLIDPLYFLDAVEAFAFDYVWYSVSDYVTDKLGRTITKFNKLFIRGSLQPGVSSLNQNLSGNYTTMQYDFYCMANYRIKIGDFIVYHGRYLHVDSLQEYDEFGVRHVKLTMINLNDYQDLKDAILYLEGEKII